MKHTTILITTLFILLFFCSGNINEVHTVDGGGTEITGYLVTTDAVPVDNASVYLIKDSTDTIKAETNDSGRYTFTTKVPDGFYTFIGKKDTLECRKLNRRYQHPYTVFTDTLWRPGWIFVIVHLENSSNFEGIEAYIPGTSFSGKSDSNGHIRIWYVPPGEYKLSFYKTGYKQGRSYVTVVSNTIDTVPLITLASDEDQVKLEKIKNLTAQIDSNSGIVTLTWDKSVDKNFNYYQIFVSNRAGRGIRPVIDSGICYDTFFCDTVYSWEFIDTSASKFRAYQAIQVNMENNGSDKSSICSLYVPKPVIPPVPECSQLTVSNYINIGINAIIPRLCWIDSLFINRTVFETTTTIGIPFSEYTKHGFVDFVNYIPVNSDSTITVSYTLQTKSIYNKRSSLSKCVKTCIQNPYTIFKINTPDAPTDLPTEGSSDMSYCLSINPVQPPLSNDTVEYRIIHKNQSDTLETATKWYTIPVIEIKFIHEGINEVRCQARSRRLYNLVSQTSKNVSINIFTQHSVPRPSTPQRLKPDGNNFVDHSNPYQYTVKCVDTCSSGHPLSIRYFISYENEKMCDSTDWKPYSDNATTIYWSKPGIGYLRAQARCNILQEVLSSWSDALVVTIK
jgi:hypothetical protein